jgi:hypothetical protein
LDFIIIALSELASRALRSPTQVLRQDISHMMRRKLDSKLCSD